MIRKSFFRVISQIFANLSAAWLALIFIVPGSFEPDPYFLTRCLAFAILNMAIAVAFDRFAS